MDVSRSKDRYNWWRKQLYTGINGRFIKRYDELPVREIWLVDIEAGREKVEIVGAMAQRMWDASPYDVKVHITLDREEALKDADFVTTQFVWAY